MDASVLTDGQDDELSQQGFALESVQAELVQHTASIAALEDQLAAAMQSSHGHVSELEASRDKLNAALAEQMTMNKNLQADLRTLFKTHKQELADLAAEYHNQVPHSWIYNGRSLDGLMDWLID